MEETPRQYKKRIDEKWERNEKNRDKLIHQIEKYELVDEEFKTRTKQEILENFEKNEKAEKEAEQYKVIVSELENIDKKYEELKRLEATLLSKKNDILEVEKAIRESKLDGEDETTLKMQMAKVRELKERLKTLKSEREELKKEIANREQEIKEIEETYGEKIMSSGTENLPSGTGGKGSYTGNIQDSSLHSEGQEGVQRKPSTLKEYHDQTIQELWKKDRTRAQIIQLLEEGTGIDNELKERIKKEISDRFFVYYDEKQGSLKMKSARFVKNKLRNETKKFENMPEGEERNEKLDEVDEIVGVYKGKDFEVKKLLDKIGIKPNEIIYYPKMGGRPVFKVKTEDGRYAVYWGKDRCGDRYNLIGKIQEIGGRPVFKAKKSGKYCIMRGNKQCCEWFDDVGGLKEIGGKPAFIVKRWSGLYEVYWGTDSCGDLYNYVGEIKEIGGKPVFKAKYGYYRVCWWRDICGDLYDYIGEIKEIGGKPVFKAKYLGRRYVVRGRKQSKRFDEVRDPVEKGGKPVFEVKEGGKWHTEKLVL